MAVKVRPLQDYILVQRVEEASMTPGGIIIPDTAKEKPQEGIVKAVGKGRKMKDGTLIPTELKVGDRVLFGKYSGTDVKIDGEDYLLIREESDGSDAGILCVFEQPSGAKKS